MLLTLLQATAQASNTASRINVEQLLDRLLNWGIEVGKTFWLPLLSTSSAGLSSNKSADWSAKFWKNVNWKSVYRRS